MNSSGGEGKVVVSISASISCVVVLVVLVLVVTAVVTSSNPVSCDVTTIDAVEKKVNIS